MNSFLRRPPRLGLRTAAQACPLQRTGILPTPCFPKQTLLFNTFPPPHPAVTLNLLRADGSHVGYAEVQKLAAINDIHVRVGCLCNTGACHAYLGLSRADVEVCTCPQKKIHLASRRRSFFRSVCAADGVCCTDHTAPSVVRASGRVCYAETPETRRRS